MGAGESKYLARGFVMAPHRLLALVNFFFNIFLAHYPLFIIKKRHYSLIIIPHPDPHTGIARALNEKRL